MNTTYLSDLTIKQINDHIEALKDELARREAEKVSADELKAMGDKRVNLVAGLNAFIDS